MAGRSSAQRRQHTAQGTRINPGIDTHRRAIAQGNLDQTGRAGGGISGGSGGCGVTSTGLNRAIAAPGCAAFNACRHM
jgi:hypothetical protein